MHKVPDDPSFPIPSGIVTVTPTGKLVVQSSNFSISNQSKNTISLTGTTIPSLLRQDYIVDLTRENGVDEDGNERDKGALRAIDTISVSGNTVTFNTVDIPAQSVYEVMNLTLKGNVDNLAARYLRSDTRSLAGGDRRRAIYVSLLNHQGTHSFTLPPGINGSAHLEYLLKLGLYLDARTSFNWDKVSASTTFYVDSAARAVINAYVSQTSGFGFRHILAKPSIGFFVGPVPVDVSAEILMGADVNFSTSGRFRVEGGFTSQLGLTAGIEAGVKWDWFKTQIYSRGYANKIDNYYSEMIGPELEMNGTATVEPYFEVRPGLRVANIVGVTVGLRTYVNGQATVVSATDTNITADFLIKAGVKGVNPELDVGINVFGISIGKKFPLGGILFDASKTVFNQQLVLARPANSPAFAPKFSVAGGTYHNDQIVTITSDTSEATIRYTLDGSTPSTTHGTLYSGPVTVDRTTTLKAIAFKSGMNPSLVSEQKYIMVVAPIVFSPDGGLYSFNQVVSLSTSTLDANIYYTTDGTDPSSSITREIYSIPLDVSLGTTIRATATKSGYSSSFSRATFSSSNIVQIAGGAWHNLALKDDGSVWAWGGNQGGVLGNGTTTAQLTPKQVLGLSNIIQIDADINSSLALKSDGTVWSWGLVNDNIQYLPVQIPGLSNIIQISMGLNHGLALKNDGTVWAWGFNNYGQLGDGTKTNRFPPIKVQGISNIIAISAGYGNSLALASDGTVWAWGYNSFGQLGVNSTQDQLFPVKISGLSIVKSIYAGSSYFSMAIKMDGTVWAWGVNYYGQLGDGTKTNRLSPVQVSGLTNVVQIVTGNGQAFALKEDGSVWGWGYSDDAYPIGTGEKTIYLTPVKISHLNGIIAIATVGYHPYASISLALDNNKRIWAWGLNNLGQVGDGTTNPRLTPVLINRF